MARDRLGRRRAPGQDEVLRRINEERARSVVRNRSHGIRMTPEAHSAFARLSPTERGALIEAALHHE